MITRVALQTAVNGLNVQQINNMFAAMYTF